MDRKATNNSTQNPCRNGVLGLIENHMVRHPNRVAICHDQEQVSYAELSRRANDLAMVLVDKGVRPGTPVAFFTKPGPHMAVAILGILKAGGAYVPVSSYPSVRINYILKDAGVPILVTDGLRPSEIKDVKAEILHLDQLPPRSTKGPLPSFSYNPNQLAYILYTSGSSGAPKGVMVSHKALFYYLQWHRDHLREDIGRVDLPLTSSMGFAAGVTQFYTPLLLGRTLHILREDLIRQPDQLCAWYEDHPEFGLYCVPTLWNALVAYAEIQKDAGRPATGPKVALLSGEAVSEKLVSRSAAVWPQTRLWNLYGPTETTANGSAGELQPGEPVNLGRPLVGTRIDLVNEANQRVDPGQIGEICICGDGVALGYVNMPELTRERFLPDPFTNSGRFLYKTGDLGMVNDQGNLIFMGRKDFQVKIRGYRINCGEVEYQLLTLPAVREAMVVCHEDPILGKKQLAAYLTFHPARFAGVDEIRSYLLKRLPDYMVPTAYVVMDTFPKLLNGKVDRSKLPAPEKMRPNLGYPCEPPGNLREKQCVRVWEDVLGLEGLGVNDHFFELGGSSLDVAAAIARFSQLLRIKVSYLQFFENPTPAGLAKTLKTLEDETQCQPIEKRPTMAAYPCPANHSSLWLLTQTVPNLTAYNLQYTLEMKGRLNVFALEKSLQMIVQRHDALRTVFENRTDNPVAKISETPIPLAQKDLRSHHQIEAEALKIAAQDNSNPYNLETGPLCRFTLLRLGETHWRLLLMAHHIAFDGASVNIFIKELTHFYRAYAANRNPDEIQQPIRFGDYALWKRENTQSEASLKAFWKKRLAGCAPVLNYPTDFARPPIQTYRGSQEKALIPNDLKETMLAYGRKMGATPFMTLFACFSALLYRHSGQEDMVIGCPVANRRHPDLENVMGYFTNVIALRSQFTKAITFQQLLMQVRENSLQSFEHQDLSFNKVVETIQPQRSLSRSPLFQVMFAFHKTLWSGFVNDSLEIDAWENGNHGAKFDMVLDVQNQQKGMALCLTYNTDLFAKPSIQRFLDQFLLLLRGAMRDDSKPVSHFNLNSQDSLHRTMSQWNAARFEHPNKFIHQLFQEQAEKHPRQTALIFNGASLTYEALNARANQLAGLLRARGVGYGVPVGVYMENSADMIVALLAAMKSGGAYVPLDPYYPKERIAYIIEDSGVSQIITQRSLAEQLSDHKTDLVFSDSEEIQSFSRENPRVDCHPQSVAYLMYTSGSTGNPKGVVVLHKGIANYVMWMRSRFPLKAEDRVLNKTSMNFDISVWEMFLPLISGAQLVLGQKQELQAPDSLAALIRREGVTVVQFVPSALKVFIDSGFLASCHSLKRIFSGGEALSVSLKEDVLAHFPGELHNLYGPTEASIYVCHQELHREDRHRSVPIGRSMHNTCVYILDKQMRPAPEGVPGELYIGGVALANGYFKKPAITAGKFVPDPFSNTPGARLFRTGDLVRYFWDDSIEFLGRMDNQVKVRGYRIELGEIEHNLIRHPQVKHAVVIVREDQANDVRLVAYLLYSDRQGPESEELRDYLKRKLPDYMIPSRFVGLDSIPLLPNNKLNIKALPKPEYKKLVNRELERNYDNGFERALSQIWEEVLETEKFLPGDNFFDVGGHSLLIVKLRSLIKQRLDIEVSNMDLFQYPSIRSLARHLNKSRRPGETIAAQMASRVSQRDQWLRTNISKRETRHDLRV